MFSLEARTAVLSVGGAWLVREPLQRHRYQLISDQSSFLLPGSSIPDVSDYIDERNHRSTAK